jgi:hypothetical protein
MFFAVALRRLPDGQLCPHCGIIENSVEPFNRRTRQLKEDGFTILRISSFSPLGVKQILETLSEHPEQADTFRELIDLGIKAGWEARSREIISHIHGRSRDPIQ